MIMNRATSHEVSARGHFPLEKAKLTTPLLEVLAEGLGFFGIILLSQSFERQRHAS
jgi:hypothetical protein